MEKTRKRSGDLEVGDTLLDILGTDRTITELTPYTHPDGDLSGWIASYVPGPTSGITVLRGDVWEVLSRP